MTSKYNLNLSDDEKRLIQFHIFEHQNDTNFMDSKLIIKNFGPIKEVELDLKNVNVFIGPQASGKSSIAKLYTILKAPRHFFFNQYNGISSEKEASSNFIQVLKDYSIASFLSQDTFIEYDSELHRIIFKDGELEYFPKLLVIINKLQDYAVNFSENRQYIIDQLVPIADKLIYFRIRVGNLLIPDNEKRKKTNVKEMFNELTSENLDRIIDILSKIERNISEFPSTYIPAERIFSNTLKKFALTFMLNDVPIPKHLLTFGAFLEKSELKDFDLNFLISGLRYIKDSQGEKIVIGEGKEIDLLEAASGIQSVIPIIETILYSKNHIYHNSFVIEEPELNLSPIAQYKLIQFLEKNRPEVRWEDTGTIHTYTTHSPYILSCFNNLLYANKVRDKLLWKYNYNTLQEFLDAEEKAIAPIYQIVDAIVAPSYFSAYQVENGTAISIFNKESGMIDENYIDAASDEINDDFDKLMELNK
jgi:hypothetical protein